ncbi:hypothetical protein N7478_010493 [Penicillium angulare]|uniref:uncharacterized protein n=1 Tax=Penicillium angulare TaxID=116970 RepID=UPI002541972B|nr:uncharacterized protein N7478_010493 [Penicillium angulare]KAJ5267685.1 hypothetical protein N7478_010493 [Penicillium angulare]
MYYLIAADQEQKFGSKLYEDTRDSFLVLQITISKKTRGSQPYKARELQSKSSPCSGVAPPSTLVAELATRFRPSPLNSGPRFVSKTFTNDPGSRS